jgi:hypothetical protein
MGSGCLGMLAVMFAVALVGVGIGILTDIQSKSIFAISAVIAGLAGLPAFIFFGYFAPETGQKTQQKGQG